MFSNSILLIGFYNTKALGVRYLEKSLKMNGHEVYTLFLKEFNSVHPEAITEKELMLLSDVINLTKPGLIGLSVMSSFYLESVIAVNEFIHGHFNIPIVWGGVYSTLFPEKNLEYADFVLRGEGEEAIVELADAVLQSTPYQSIKNLAFKRNGKYVINEVRPLYEDLDKLGYPLFNNDNKFFIDNEKLTYEDPMLKSVSYELTASRGCPFMCSYCSSINLKRIYRESSGYVRFRGVASIISEIEEAISGMKNLKVLHFWDEIFPDDKDWIDDFSHQYKNKIGLPFEIWGHPLKIDDYTLSKLVDAGLYKVVMGIQSGSPTIRKEIFHRIETQEDILEASAILSRQKVPQVIFDFMLRHPFEKEEDIKQTYDLCTKLTKPFELQLHGLSFLPGTDIINIAIARGIADKQEIESNIYGSIQEQYNIYWGQGNRNIMMDFWYSLIYISQFRTGMMISKYYSKAAKSSLNINIVLKLPRLYSPLAKVRYINKKTKLLVRAYISQIITSRKSKSVLHLVKE